jgi:hypothetical protein
VIASNDSNHYLGDEPELIELLEPQLQRWRVPRVLFCRV